MLQQKCSRSVKCCSAFLKVNFKVNRFFVEWLLEAVVVSFPPVDAGTRRAKGWVHAGWVHAGWLTPRPDLWLTCGGGDSLADPSLRKITPRSLRGVKREAVFTPPRRPSAHLLLFVSVLFTMWRKWPGPGKRTLNPPPKLLQTPPDKV